MHLAISPIFWWPAIAVAAVLLFALVFWVYRDALSGQPRRWRVAAMALRLTALALALAAMLRPSLVFTETRKQSASLLLLYDDSRSMLVADAWDGLPRWRALNQIRGRSREALQSLSEELEIREYKFDSSLSETSRDVVEEDSPAGSSTAIGDVLREAVKKAPGRVAGIILLTDGANTSGTPALSVARNLKDLTVPVYSVGFGQEAAIEASRDLAVRNIAAGPTVFEKNKLTVTAELEARGFSSQPVNVRLLFDDYQADAKTIELAPQDGRTKLELSYVPNIPGEHKVTIQVSEPDPKKGELVETNNTISTFVTVLKGGLRVQYLDGGLEAWEPRFIRWSLDKSPDIKVDFSWIRDQGAIAQGDATLFDRSLYDVFLVRDIPRAWFPNASLDKLRKAVESGAGFAMLGGRQSFGPGGYAASPVGVILPVNIHPGDQQINRLLPTRPTAQGLAHFVMRLGPPQETPRIWESLHPLDGATAFSGVKNQARVLAESPDQVPLIVAQDFGNGRTMAIAGDSTRHWYRQSEQGLRHHRRFWRQVILWLARKEQAGESRVWLDLAKRRVAAGEGLDLTAGAEDEQGNPILDGEFEVSASGPSGSPVPVKLVPQGERMRGTFWGTDKAGEYEVSVTVRRGGQELGPPRTAKFIVFEDDSELNAPAADLSLLAQIAEVTGGEYVQPERLPYFLENLRKKDLHLEIERLTQFRLWDNYIFFLIFVALLTGEWAL